MASVVLIASLIFSAEIAGPVSSEHVPVWETANRTIEVRAVDESGRPVAGAEVLCVSEYNRPFSPELKDSERRVTDATGKCTFSNLIPNHYTIRVVSGDIGCWTWAFAYPQDAFTKVEARVGKYLNCKGTVCDVAGTPIGGVAVFYGGVKSAMTDDTGRFLIRNMPGADEWGRTPQLLCLKPGYGWVFQLAGPESNLVRVVMREGGPARVHVTDPHGKPVPDLKVEYGDGKGGGFLSGLTDAEGYLTTTPMPVDIKAFATAGLMRDGYYYFARQEFDVKSGQTVDVTLTLKPDYRIKESGPLPNGNLLRTYFPVNGPEGVDLKGCIVSARGGKPVPATVICRYGNKKIMTRTEPDGSFLIEQAPKVKSVKIEAVPDDPVICVPSGGMEINPEEASKSALVLKTEKGCAIRGRVFEGEDQRPRALSVTLRPSFKTNPGLLDVEYDGTFELRNLGTERGEFELAFKRHEREEICSVPIGKLKKGRLIDDVVVHVPAEETAIGVLKGLVVDPDGAPAPGITVKAPKDFADKRAVTDLDGKFSLQYKKKGPTMLSCEKTAVLSWDGAVRTGNATAEIQEGAAVDLGSQTADPHRIVVRPPVMPLLAGYVKDEDGNPVNPHFFNWHGGDGTGNSYCENGVFIMDTLVRAPEILEFAHDGYQAKVLIRGRDFNIGDTNVTAVLKRGPLPQCKSIFETVTGVPLSQKESVPQYKRIWQNLRNYRQYAGNGTGLWLRVTDAKGNPVNEILFWRGIPFAVSGLPDVEHEPKESDVLKLTSENGCYILQEEWRRWYVWGPGLGRVLNEDGNYEDQFELHEVVLHPAARLTVKVTDTNGAPIPGAFVLLRPEWDLMQTLGRVPMPKADDSGQIVFKNLSPGNYVIQANATIDGKYLRQEVVSTIKAGEEAKETVPLAES